jgi:hypothetical protein
MRFLSTKTHGVLDYLMGIVLIAAPWILGFAEGGAETWVPVIIGASAIVYSLMTDYEMGASKTISMPTHLWLDGISGAVLAASPWLFGFSDYVFWPHLILGIAEIGSALVTQTQPEHSREMHRSHH